ncbi:unnamed protein product [Malus baccata var. baccata]
MDVRVAALETVVANLNSSLSNTLDAKLTLYFEQFCRELACNPALGPPRTQIQYLLFSWLSNRKWTLFALLVASSMTGRRRPCSSDLLILRGEALQWFRWLDSLQSTPRWEEFTKAFCKEFGPSEFEDCTEALFKLRQSGTFKDYTTEFHILVTRTTNVGPSLRKSCFLGCLKKELKFDVKLLRPNTVHEAIDLALQIDTKHYELRNTHPKPSVPFRPQNQSSAPSFTHVPRHGSLYVKKLSPKEIQR